MNAVEKTKAAQRVFLPIGLLEPREDNPNKMSARQFDLLVDNLERTGLTDPILVRPISDGKYRIVGGHHRYEGAKYLGFEDVPCTVIDDPDFDEEAEMFQVVRMNVIKGKLDPAAFFSMYEKMSGKYETQVLQELFGFSESAEFAKLIAKSAKVLPPELQAKFKEAAKEIKTIDGLAQLLNEMFTKYGDTLPFGFMIADYGGQQSIWLQISKATKVAFDVIGMRLREEHRTVDDVIGHLLQSIADGHHSEMLEAAIAAAPVVNIPAGFGGLGTKEALAAAEEIS
jgi:hypothetical protein